jgi:hypothetical protein
MNMIKFKRNHHLVCTALFVSEIPFPAQMVSRILRMLMRIKQTMPKLCRGRMVCQTGFALSVEVHTDISVKRKMISKMKSTMRVAIICVIIHLPVAS